MPVSLGRWRALGAAAVALWAAQAWLALTPGAAVRWGTRMGSPGRDPRPLDAIRDLSTAVAAIGRRPPFSATCLEQSLALVMLLSCARVPAHLVLGVSRAASTLRAHAWVECGGAVVHGGAHVAGFAPLVPHLPASSSSVPSSCPG
jgi:hypothetical protein